MHLHTLDIAIIVGYFVVVVLLGLWVSRKGTKDLDAYFLGGKSMPWYLLGVSDASGMFDIAGVFAGMFVLSAFVLLIDGLVTVIERRLLVWRPAPDRH